MAKCPCNGGKCNAMMRWDIASRMIEMENDKGDVASMYYDANTLIDILKEAKLALMDLLNSP